jgi:hypothetical protein
VPPRYQSKSGCGGRPTGEHRSQAAMRGTCPSGSRTQSWPIAWFFPGINFECGENLPALESPHLLYVTEPPGLFPYFGKCKSGNIKYCGIQLVSISKSTRNAVPVILPARGDTGAIGAPGVAGACEGEGGPTLSQERAWEGFSCSYTGCLAAAPLSFPPRACLRPLAIAACSETSPSQS